MSEEQGDTQRQPGDDDTSTKKKKNLPIQKNYNKDRYSGTKFISSVLYIELDLYMMLTLAQYLEDFTLSPLIQQKDTSSKERKSEEIQQSQ